MKGKQKILLQKTMSSITITRQLQSTHARLSAFLPPNSSSTPRRSSVSSVVVSPIPHVKVLSKHNQHVHRPLFSDLNVHDRALTDSENLLNKFLNTDRTSNASQSTPNDQDHHHRMNTNIFHNNHTDSPLRRSMLDEKPYFVTEVQASGLKHTNPVAAPQNSATNPNDVRSFGRSFDETDVLGERF
ncbi:unnamed protein product, partial [Didymodactylos carnosus]